jgi:hypothetical protein
MVGELLREMGYSLQSNRKTSEGKQHPDRNEQFEFINLLAEETLARGNPVISVDAKKKELVGNFKNAGQQWRPKGNPREVDVYDFLSQAEGRATPSNQCGSTIKEISFSRAPPRPANFRQ